MDAGALSRKPEEMLGVTLKRQASNTGDIAIILILLDISLYMYRNKDKLQQLAPVGLCVNVSQAGQVQAGFANITAWFFNII